MRMRTWHTRHTHTRHTHVHVGSLHACSAQYRPWAGTHMHTHTHAHRGVHAHRASAAHLRDATALHHGGRKGALDGLQVLRAGPACALCCARAWCPHMCRRSGSAMRSNSTAHTRARQGRRTAAASKPSGRATHAQVHTRVCPPPTPATHTPTQHPPVSSMMRSSWFMVLLPGKMALPLSNSPRMQPGRAWRAVGGAGARAAARRALVWAPTADTQPQQHATHADAPHHQAAATHAHAPPPHTHTHRRTTCPRQTCTAWNPTGSRARGTSAWRRSPSEWGCRC
jgi:hypothetical protein